MQSDFKKSGRLGCSQCYETFAEGLLPLLRSMHKGEQHVGKCPTRMAGNETLLEQLKLLKQDLENAIKAENFETAAKLRDQIRKLEQKHPAPGKS